MLSIMTTKCEVDPTTQGSMLPPVLPASLAVGQVVELEGVYYKSPEKPSLPLTPEQEVMKAEADALLFLDLACRSQRNIANMVAHKEAVESGIGNVRPNTDVATELERLGNPKNGVIRTAKEHRMHFRRQAKLKFAQSIGTETVVRHEERMDHGIPIPIPIIRAKDPQQDAEFQARFRAFYDEYGHPEQKHKREAQRQRLLAATQSQQAAA